MKKIVLQATKVISILSLLALTACGDSSVIETSLTLPPEQVAEIIEVPSVSLEPETAQTVPAQPIVQENLELEVKIGYSVSTDFLGLRLHYVVMLYNPNDHVAVRFPSFRVTAFAEDGRVLGTRRSVRGDLNPISTSISIGSLSVDEHPARVEVEAEAVANRDWISNFELYEPFEIEGANISSRGNILGTIVNPNNIDFDRVKITVVYLNEYQEIVGGVFSYITGGLSALGSAHFEVLGRDFEGAYRWYILAFTD